MKKAFISVAGLALATMVLASCSNNSLKAPKKGKAVDSIKLKYDSEEIEIKKDDKIEDVINSIFSEQYSVFLDYNAIADNKASIGYKSLEKSTNKFKEENGVQKYGTSFDKRSYSSNYELINDSYGYYEFESNDDFLKNYISSSVKSNITDTIDKAKSTSKRNGLDVFVGTRKLSNDKYDIKVGTYNKGTSKNTGKDNHEKGNESRKINEYTYVKDTYDADDYTAYSETHYGNKGDNEYSYSYSNYPFDIHVSGFWGIDSDDVYDITYKDLYESASFELTDKEIIFKTKSVIIGDIFDYIYTVGDSYNTDEEFIQAIKKAADNEFKGSYIENEVWISYDSENFDKKGFTYSYKKTTEYSKYKIEYEWTKEKLEGIGQYNEITKSYVGKKYRKEGSSKEVEIKVTNSLSYDKKMDNLFTKAEKNNVYDGIYFTTSNPWR